jgi:hypothetical protein
MISFRGCEGVLPKGFEALLKVTNFVLSFIKELCQIYIHLGQAIILRPE